MSDHKTTLAAYSTSAWTSLAGFFGALTANDVALYIGIFCTIGTFAVNWYYQRKRFQMLARLPFPTLQKEEL